MTFFQRPSMNGMVLNFCHMCHLVLFFLLLLTLQNCFDGHFRRFVVVVVFVVDDVVGVLVVILMQRIRTRRTQQHQQLNSFISGSNLGLNHFKLFPPRLQECNNFAPTRQNMWKRKVKAGEMNAMNVRVTVSNSVFAPRKKDHQRNRRTQIRQKQPLMMHPQKKERVKEEEQCVYQW